MAYNYRTIYARRMRCDVFFLDMMWNGFGWLTDYETLYSYEWEKNIIKVCERKTPAGIDKHEASIPFYLTDGRLPLLGKLCKFCNVATFGSNRLRTDDK